MSKRLDRAAIVLRPTPFLKSLHVVPRLGAVYVNNPKVACSTIKLALQRAQLSQPDYLPAKSVHDHEGSPLLTWPDVDSAQAAQHLADAFVFSFVRNPYTRLQSAYANKILEPQKNGAFRRSAGFDKDDVPDFDDFVEALTKKPAHKHNPHWRSQWINLSIDAIRFDFIGRLERFDADWAEIAARLRLPANPERAGKVSAREKIAYSARSAATVATIYARDFETFGYDPGDVPI